LKIHRISTDSATSTIVTVNETDKTCILGDIRNGQYVAVAYDQDWYLGCIMEISENQDALINFMQPKGPAKSYSRPRRRDECWIPVNYILCTNLDLVTITGRQYKLDETSDRRS
jgi:hypothetical protein